MKISSCACRGEEQHMHNYYPFIPSTDILVPSYVSNTGSRNEEESGVMVLSSTSFQTRRRLTREGRAVEGGQDINLWVRTQDWARSILQVGRGAYQAILHREGDGFSWILKTAVFMKQDGTGKGGRYKKQRKGSDRQLKSRDQSLDPCLMTSSAYSTQRVFSLWVIGLWFSVKNHYLGTSCIWAQLEE